MHVIDPLCPVRACALPLLRRGRAWRCARGHSFDLAASGYCNLLQPQDRRAKAPGDSAEAARARRRWLEGGRGEPLRRALEDCVEGVGITAGDAILDSGCGEGFFLAALARRFGLDACGVDISSAAVDAAARRHRGILWLVANADRRLPFADGTFRLALSVCGRLNAPELRRVLAPGGALIAAVPGPDDLVELRAAVLGQGLLPDRGARVLRETAARFTLERRTGVRATIELDAAAIADALALSYRGARRSQQARAAGLPGITATQSFELLVLRPR